MPRCLAICHKQLGDLVLLEPALARLSAASGGPIGLLTRSGHSPLISLMENVRITARVGLRRFDGVYCYDAHPKSAWYALTTISPRKELILRAPTETTRFHRVVFREIRAPGLGDEFLARYNWANTRPDFAATYRAPQLNAPPAVWRPDTAPDGDYLLLNSTAGWKSKRWSVSGWVTVLRGLLDDGVGRVLVTSGDQDWQLEHVRRITESLADPRVSFLGGRTRLEEFLWLVAHARLVLGVDGAAAHLANAFGGRSLTLFFKTNPHHWHHPTPTARALVAPVASATDKPTLAADEVLAAARDLWGLP